MLIVSEVRFEEDCRKLADFPRFTPPSKIKGKLRREISRLGSET